MLSLVTLAGGLTDTPAGEQTQVVISLTEGQYVLVCSAAGEDGVPHFAKGMLKPITVVARTNPAVVSEPKSDVSVVMRDFAFDIPSEIKAGPRVWQFTNQGQQMHEMSIVKLAPGKTLEDVLAFAQTFEGEPPGEEMTNIRTTSPGQRLWVNFDLAAGDYVMICFFPDMESGMPHAMLGMMQPFSVK